MSDQENFLTRWSRKKRDAAEQPAPVPPVADTSPNAPPSPGAGEDKAADERTPATSAPKPTTPAFDPASLPSLDSIGAQTDISAFLKPGVPSDLRLAALRRAWSADPAIRDFVGLAENAWDFTDPEAMPGFGELDPSVDVKKMLAQMFGETPRADRPPTEIPAPAEQPTPQPHELISPTDRAALDSVDDSVRDPEIADPHRTEATENDKLLQREENIAARDDDSKHDGAQVKRRRSQGGALPQ